MPSNQPAARHPYAIDYQSDAAGKHIKASKRRVLFRFGFSPDGRTANLENEHVVTLSWSPTSGKAVLAADGKEIHLAGGGSGSGNADGNRSSGSKKRLLIGSKFKFEHSFEMAGRTAAAATSHTQDTNSLASKSISELKSIASQKQIDLSGCLEKGDIVARISAAAVATTGDGATDEPISRPTHQIRIVAHATQPLGASSKGSASGGRQQRRQFDLFVDGTSYFDLPKCHQLDDGQMGIVGLSVDDEEGAGQKGKGEASTTGADTTSEPPSPGVKGALSQMERGDLQKLLDRIEERKRRGSLGGSRGKHQSGPADAAADNTKSNVATLSNDNAEEALGQQDTTEEEIEQLQNRLADLSYLPFLEMIAKDDNADVVRRGGAIAEGEIQRNWKRIAELETVALRTAMGGVAEDARDHQMAVQEVEMLRSRIADLEKLVEGEEGAGGGSGSGSGSGDETTPTSNRSDSVASFLLSEDQRHLSEALEGEDRGAEEPPSEASFLSFLSMMGEQEGEMKRREREAAEEKANRLKALIGNLESLADDSSA